MLILSHTEDVPVDACIKMVVPCKIQIFYGNGLNILVYSPALDGGIYKDKMLHCSKSKVWYDSDKQKFERQIVYIYKQVRKGKLNE